jgi:hypothetical protein
MIVVGKFIDFILFLDEKCKSIVKSNDEEVFAELQTDIAKNIRYIPNNSLKEICIFFADDFLIKKFDKWKGFLIEKYMMKTSSGGGAFFERFDQYIVNCDYEMCVVCLTAMQVGFTGYLDNTTEEYRNYLNKFKQIFSNKNMVKRIKIDSYEPKYTGGRAKLSISVILIFAIIFFPFLQNTYYTIQMFHQLNVMYGGLGV